MTPGERIGIGLSAMIRAVLGFLYPCPLLARSQAPQVMASAFPSHLAAVCVEAIDDTKAALEFRNLQLVTKSKSLSFDST